MIDTVRVLAPGEQIAPNPRITLPLEVGEQVSSLASLTRRISVAIGGRWATEPNIDSARRLLANLAAEAALLAEKL